MQKIKIEWLPRSHSHAAQIYDSGLEYCFISDDMKQCHAMVYCKDFLQDTVQAFLNNKTASIYGFNYNSKSKPALTTKSTLIALTNKSDNKFLERIPNMLDFINQFAKRLKLKPTKCSQVENPPSRYEKCGVVLTEGSSRWMNSPPMLSMYALMLRCGPIHKIGMDCMDTVSGIISGKIAPYQSSDRSQLAGSLSGIKKILENGYRKFFYVDNVKNYPGEIDIDTMHGSAGIMGFSCGYTKSICPYWHRKSLNKKAG